MDAVGGSRLRRPATGVRCVRTSANAKEDGGIEGMVFKKEEEEAEEPLSPVSRLFHGSEGKGSVHIIAIMGSKTPIDAQVVKSRLEHTLLKHPRFSSLLVVDEKKNRGEVKWVRTRVDVERHVIVPDLDAPPPTQMGAQKWVEDYISNLSTTGLDPSMPQWDLHLLNLRTAADTAATAVLRVNHCLGDGVSLLSLLLACTRKVSDPEALPTLPGKGRSIEAGRRNGHCGFFKGIWLAVRLCWNTFIDLALFLATALFLNDTDTPLRATGIRKDCGRRFVLRTVSFEDVKLVKGAMGATINDVILGVVQAALSRYLNRRYGETAGRDEGSTQRKNNLPKKIRLRAPLLINLRPSTGIPLGFLLFVPPGVALKFKQDLADMMSKGSDAKWGNRIGYVLLPFTIGLRDDPLDYVREAKATVDRKKHSLESLCTFPIANFANKLFAMKDSTSILTCGLPSNTTVCFSNMVGPQEEIGFYGHSLSYLAPCCYGQSQSLSIHAQTYFNKLTFVLAVDEFVIPDPHRLCDDLEESLELIKEAVLARTKAGGA